MRDDGQRPGHRPCCPLREGTLIDESGRVDGNAFVGTATNPHPSCHWLEIFGPDEAAQIDEVRKRSRLSHGATAVFARLNAGQTKALVSREASVELRFVHAPLEAAPGYPDDPSHCEIHGVPMNPDPVAEFIGDLISQTLISTFPARAPKTL